MTKLNELINRNRELLDDIEPLPGHFDRFAKKLERGDNIRTIIIPLIAAASIATLITIVLFSIKINYESEISLGDISIEYKEAEIYYQNIFLTEYDKFQESIVQPASLENYVEKELEIMTQAYEQLINDFRTNPYDPRVISAIITHYQTKVDFIKKINEQIEDNKVKNLMDYNYDGNRI